MTLPPIFQVFHALLCPLGHGSYYDAYVAVNGVRSTESLKLLAPGDTLVCNIASGGIDSKLTIESDHLLPRQIIGYKANL